MSIKGRQWGYIKLLRCSSRAVKVFGELPLAPARTPMLTQVVSVRIISHVLPSLNLAQDLSFFSKNVAWESEIETILQRSDRLT